MSVMTCWKRPPRAEHSLSMAARSTVRAMAAAEVESLLIKLIIIHMVTDMKHSGRRNEDVLH